MNSTQVISFVTLHYITLDRDSEIGVEIYRFFESMAKNSDGVVVGSFIDTQTERLVLVAWLLEGIGVSTYVGNNIMSIGQL